MADEYYPNSAEELEQELIDVLGRLEEFNKYRQNEHLSGTIKKLRQCIPSVMPNVWGFVLRQLEGHDSDMWLKFEKSDLRGTTHSFAVGVKKMDEKPQSDFIEKVFKIKQ